MSCYCGFIGHLFTFTDKRINVFTLLSLLHLIMLVEKDAHLNLMIFID